MLLRPLALMLSTMLSVMALICIVAFVLVEAPPEKPDLCPGPNCPLTPKLPTKPTQPSKPKPKPRCPHAVAAGCQAVGLVSEDDEESKESIVNGREYDGEVVTVDFPGCLYMPNIGSHRDGAGMCVATSITMIAKDLGLKDYYDFRDWCAREPGGASRTKIDDQVTRYEQAKGITNPVPYLQYEGPEPEPILDAIDKARLPFAHTYGWSPRYKSRIAHMVANLKYNGNFSVVLDNNPMSDFDIPNNHFHEWMSREEMVRRAKLGGGNMWIFCWLAPPPPPCPKVG